MLTTQVLEDMLANILAWLNKKLNPLNKKEMLLRIMISRREKEEKRREKEVQKREKEGEERRRESRQE